MRRRNLAATDRKPIDQAIDRIRFESATDPADQQSEAAGMAASASGGIARPANAVDCAAQIRYRRALALGFGRCSRPRQLLRVSPLNLQPRRGQESFGAVYALRRALHAAPPIQRPTDTSARGFASSFC